MFSISDAAAKQIKSQLEQANVQTMSLRFAATLGDDRSIQYMMGFDDSKDNDLKLDINGIHVLMDQVSYD